MTTPALDSFAIVAPGLEALALAEARALGLPAQLAEGGGGIEWQGDLRDLLRANMGLRIASRVVVRLARFEARSFAELERHARKVDWKRIVAPGGAVRFRVTCKKSRLYHSDAVAQRLADAVIRAVPGARAEGSSVADEDDSSGSPAGSAHPAGDAQLVIVRFLRDVCTVSADTSGELLHRRGYRQATAKAPMRETLAAAMLAASGWDGVSNIVDPLCGSGTIPIEAALVARGIPPNLERVFAVERWPHVARSVVVSVRRELGESVRASAPVVIRGSDRDAGAVVSARENAERAGVAGDVEFAERAVSAMVFPDGPPGWVVTNPPYGVRVGEESRVRDLWAQVGKVLRAQGRGWRVTLLSPDPALERQLAIPLKVVATTTNGGIPVRIVTGVVP